MQTKLCRKCNVEFPTTPEFFYRNSGGKFGLTPRCKPCVNEDNVIQEKKRKATDPEAFKAKARARSRRSYYKDLERSREISRNAATRARANPEKRERIYARKRANGAGLSIDELNALFEKQGFKCAICETTDPANKEKSNGWNVDHCHKTGKVRFILCQHCNRGLGGFRDNPLFLRKAADLLEKQQQEHLNDSLSSNDPRAL